jgi:hypothetical protein
MEAGKDKVLEPNELQQTLALGAAVKTALQTIVAKTILKKVVIKGQFGAQMPAKPRT